MQLTEILQSKRGLFNACSMGYTMVWDVPSAVRICKLRLATLSGNYILARMKMTAFTQNRQSLQLMPVVNCLFQYWRFSDD